MNYYTHHIGDYAEATTHLSPLEDGIYSRLIRKYYANEQPLPSDIAVIARQIGARTQDERFALEAVLQDFFNLQEDGWHQARCDAEIEVFHAKQAGSADAKENAKVRQRRAREHRATLFSQLRALGLVPPFTTTTQDLAQILADYHAGKQQNEFGLRAGDGRSNANVFLDVTRDVGAVTRDDTVSPNTNNQAPISKNQKEVRHKSGLIAVPTGFLEFWNAWPKSPRKKARTNCAAVWHQKGYEKIASEIVTHVKAKAQTNWADHGGKYVEAPLVYLNQARWDGAELPTNSSKQLQDPRKTRHTGLHRLDHNKGVNEDGSLAC